MKAIEFVQEIEGEAIVLGPLDVGTPVIVSALPFVTNGMTVQVAQPLEMTPNTMIQGPTQPLGQEINADDEPADAGEDVTESRAPEDTRR